MCCRVIFKLPASLSSMFWWTNMSPADSRTEMSVTDLGLGIALWDSLTVPPWGGNSLCSSKHCWRASFGEKPVSFCSEDGSSWGSSGLFGMWVHLRGAANTFTCPWAVLALLQHWVPALCPSPCLSRRPSGKKKKQQQQNNNTASPSLYFKKPSRCDQNLVIRGTKSVPRYKTAIRMAMPLWETNIIWVIPFITSSPETWWDGAWACWGLKARDNINPCSHSSFWCHRGWVPRATSLCN